MKTPSRATIEWILVVIGMVVLFVHPHYISGDGDVRHRALTELLVRGGSHASGYSLIGPLFAAPLWWLDRMFDTQFWCSRFNVFVFVVGLLALRSLLVAHLEPMVLRRMLLFLTYASMFPHHLLDFYGETFSAMCIAVGLALVCLRRSWWGWFWLVLGTANIPASLVGLGVVAVLLFFSTRSWRWAFLPLLALAAILLENTIRRGHPFQTGYEGNHGFATILPFSGQPGFSYPFLLGVLAILFSFGKGLVFFAPGLLQFRTLDWLEDKDMRQLAVLWLGFLVGLVLVYAKWWSWYGGWYWGAAFLLVRVDACVVDSCSEPKSL